MRKSTVHCPTYYNITYLGELLEHEDEEEDATEEKTDAGCSYGSSATPRYCSAPVASRATDTATLYDR